MSGTRIVSGNGEGSAKITAWVNGVKKDSFIVNVSLKPVSISNGQIIKQPNRTGYPEVTVNAPANANCYVYLKNTDNRFNSIAFYVKAGSRATVNVAKGTYVLYYATGDTWYGEKHKFGKGTNFYKSDDTTTLSSNNRSYDTVEYTLYAVPNGNMDTEQIDENEFPS